MKYSLELLCNGKYSDHSFEGTPSELKKEIERLEDSTGGIVLGFADEEGREYRKIIMGRAV